MSGGRYIDPDIGALAGEGAQQEVSEEEQRLEEIAVEAFDRVPSEQDLRDGATYYERPVLKHPVWKWYIAAYFVAGGIAGASAALAAAAQGVGGGSMDRLTRRSRYLAAATTTIGTGFLIADLGRPERFLNMLRVFRPTSPMSVGSWILAPATGAAVASAVLPGALGDAAGLASGLLGAPLAAYSAALTSSTAVPIWQATRKSLPALYVGSAVSGAASLLELGRLNRTEERALELFGLAGKVGELAAISAVDKDAGRVERVGRPLKEGVAGSLWKAAKMCTAASIAVSLFPGRRPWKRRTAAALGLIGSTAAKFAVFRAGFASGLDPRTTFDQQRSGYGAAEVTGRSGVTGPNGERALPS
jgi:hypothetical protein